MRRSSDVYNPYFTFPWLLRLLWYEKDGYGAVACREGGERVPGHPRQGATKEKKDKRLYVVTKRFLLL